MRVTYLKLFCLSLLLTTTTQSQADLIDNGDFEAGNTGFTSDYAFIAGVSTSQGQYSVRSDPESFNALFYAMPDHTSGAGKMMVVDGATSGTPSVWRETVAVVPDTTYLFSAWVSTAVNGGPASLEFSINESPLGVPFTAPLETGSWIEFAHSWNSGSSTSADIKIVNGNLSVFPNDFYLDDISFIPEPTGFALLLTGGAGLAAYGGRRRRRHESTLHAPPSGATKGDRGSIPVS